MTPPKTFSQDIYLMDGLRTPVGKAFKSLKNLTAEAQIHAPGYLDDPDINRSFPEPTGKLKKQLLMLL